MNPFSNYPSGNGSATREPSGTWTTNVESLYNALNLRVLEQFFPAWLVLQSEQVSNRLQYISANSASFLGYPAGRLHYHTLQDLFKHVHPDDAEPFRRICQKNGEMLGQTNALEAHQYRHIINYRLRKGNGHSIHVHHELFQLPDEQGKNWCFSLIKDITDEKPFTRVQLETYQLQNGAYRKISNYVPTLPDQLFTHREMEILQLIKAGLSSKEIAAQLFISLNTVRNHRSSLFRKTSARNLVELLRYAEAERM